MKNMKRKALSIFVAVCMLLSMNAAGLTAFAAVDTNQAVWVYHAGETEPYATYDTITNAVFTSAKANDIIELHGDITTTATVTISKSVTIRSEAGKDHSWSINVAANTSALKMGSAVVLYLGGGSEYGTITADMNGSGNFLLMNQGTAYIEDGIIIQNANCGTADGGAVRMISTSYAQTLYVNGGVFKNNTAAKGGAISLGNSRSTLHLNGGTFDGNVANATVDGVETPLGSAIYHGGVMYVGGSPEFKSGQEVYIYIANTNVNVHTGENALIKEAEINKVIPVRIGYKLNNIYEKRNILASDTVDVKASDLEKIIAANEDSLGSKYKKIGYTEVDETTKKPVLELVPAFVENYDNFIDDDYTSPITSGGARSKTAKWLDEDKSQAEIIITEKTNEPASRVLVLASLCGAHGLTATTIKSVVNMAAKGHDVDYYFGSITCGYKPQFSGGIAGNTIGPKSGTVLRGKTMGTLGISDSLYSGAHNGGGLFATYLQQKLQEQSYGTIILIFDNFDISSYLYTAYTPTEQIAFYQVANLLKPYYDNNQVIWVSSGTHLSGIDYEKQTSVSVENSDKLLEKGIYSSDGSEYHYEIGRVTDDDLGYAKYDKFCNFFNMALMDPATWLEGVADNRIPEWEEYNLNTNGVSYKEAEDIDQYFDALFKRDEVVIRDKVDSDLPVNSVYFEISNDSGTTWQTITDDPLITIERDGQEVCCTMKNTAYLYSDMRLRIVCDCPNEFCTEDHKAKDTNVGNATITYKYEGNEIITNNLKSPQLLKESKVLVISKEVDETYDSGDCFLFHVTGGPAGHTVDMYVSMQAGESRSISGLRPGEYTVEEVTDWSWRYKIAGDETKAVTITEDDISKEVEFSNEFDKKLWLSGTSHMLNDADTESTIDQPTGQD